MRNSLAALGFAFCTCLLPMPAFAAAPPITVHDAWIRLLPADLPLAGYFTLHNAAPQTIELLAVTSPAFTRIELHRSSESGGMEHMAAVARIAIPSGHTLRFAPGGYHLMLWRARALHVGEKVPLTLEFTDGRKIT
ncbi:MAG TPA: copper chaperone PCu(A)C, partial [Gammaproteobacteria bacterium]|nr:copper chaperone PCu(A)C [Gammaproteobacteria bacterium]